MLRVSTVAWKSCVLSHLDAEKETPLASSQDALKQLDESPISGFQLKTVITAGMGFFTDAYDLFVIGVVSSILKQTWHINSVQVSLLSSAALLAAVLGAFVFGRVADIKPTFRSLRREKKQLTVG